MSEISYADDIELWQAWVYFQGDVGVPEEEGGGAVSGEERLG